MTGADLLVKILKAEGIRQCFCFPMSPIIEAMARGGTPRHHHAAGTRRRQHGGRRLAFHQRQRDRRLHRAGAGGLGECVRRRRPGAHRFDAAALPARPSRHLLCRPAADLRQHRELRRDDEDGAEGAGRRSVADQAAPGLHGAPLRQAAAGDAGAAGRRLRRRGRRRPALCAGAADALCGRRGRGAGGRRAPARGRDAADLGRPGRALCGGERRTRRGRRTAGRAGGDDAAGQERDARGASAGGGRGRAVDHRHDRPLSAGERLPCSRWARA